VDWLFDISVGHTLLGRGGAGVTSGVVSTSLQEHIPSSVKASCLSALWHFEASPGAVTCETACPFTGCRAHSALMGDGGTGSFLSSDPPDPAM
jgi:hypothetical protein